MQMAELSRQQVNLQQLSGQPAAPALGDIAPAAAARDIVTEHNLSVGATGEFGLCRSPPFCQTLFGMAVIRQF